ncbi:MAG: OsmC family protein [Gammaproteobacteria bacterium]|nr:OsmC family protein [Gammaproteobacteria bacterium]
MKSLKLTYDGDQHATALKEPHHNVVAIDCPITAKGDEFSPGNLLGISVAGCMLLSMGAVAQRDRLDLSDTVVDIVLTETSEPYSHVDTITLAFNVPRDFAFSDRLKMERAAELCPIKHSFGEDTVVAATFNYSEAKAA